MCKASTLLACLAIHFVSSRIISGLHEATVVIYWCFLIAVVICLASRAISRNMPAGEI